MIGFPTRTNFHTLSLSVFSLSGSLTRAVFLSFALSLSLPACLSFCSWTDLKRLRLHSAHDLSLSLSFARRLALSHSPSFILFLSIYRLEQVAYQLSLTHSLSLAGPLILPLSFRLVFYFLNCVQTLKDGAQQIQKHMLWLICARCGCNAENSNSHELELHRPSIKGTELLFKLMKAIIIIDDVFGRVFPSD